MTVKSDQKKFPLLPPEPNCIENGSTAVCKQSSTCSILSRYIPSAHWLPKYFSTENVSSIIIFDIIAGITVGIMAIPQSMAYANIASLPPVCGMYTSMISAIVYPFFGTSGQLHVGPIAIVSMVTNESFKQLGINDTADKVHVGSLLAFQSGVILLLLGLLDAGILANMLSHSVIVGFTFAAALLICRTQFGELLGINVSKDGGFFLASWETLTKLKDTHVPTLLMSLLCITLLLCLKKFKNPSESTQNESRFSQLCTNFRSKYAKFIPSALIAVILGIAFIYATNNSYEFKVCCVSYFLRVERIFWFVYVCLLPHI